MSSPSAAVIVFPGSNGDRDLLEALARNGFSPRRHPHHRPIPKDVALAGLPGGFAYGDYWRAGMLASQAAAVTSLRDFSGGGGLVLGICNGFQILVEAGLLPGALAHNDPPGFIHRIVEVEVTQAAQASPWLAGVAPGTRLRMPMAHGEGNYFHPDGNAAIEPRMPLRYRRNPNGAMADAAALTDATGHILGIMPHPERATDPALGLADGNTLFAAAQAFLRDRR